MAAAAPIYDLMLLLDVGAEDSARAKIVADARTAIKTDGSLVGEQAWGVRPLSYEISHRNQAEYHLLQFSGPPSLIASLEHSLRITDGVLRHRVIRLPRGATPVAASDPEPAKTAPAASPAGETDSEPAGA